MKLPNELRCAGWLTLSLPEGWTAEESEECLSLFRRDNGVGVIQLSTYHRESWETDPAAAAHGLLTDVVRDLSTRPDAVEFSRHTQHGASVAYSQFPGPGPDAGLPDLWRVWCFADGAKMI